MRYGANFPHVIGKDPAAIRDYLQTIEGSGFDYLLSIDHVAGVHPERFGPSGPPFNYTHETPTHELLTFFAFAAAVTQRLELVPSVLLLPQRPTVLAAKQAAEIAILSGGRLRVVAGIGWNHIEYAALGADFHNRGRRLEEQIEVMKLLWSQPLVTYQGRWHDLDRVALNPLPDQPIPLWMGGGAEDNLLRRYARYAEGWMPLLMPGVDAVAAMERLRGFLHEADRDPARFGLDVRLNVATGEPKDWVAGAKRWQSAGATHLVLQGNAPGRTPMQAVEVITRARQVLEQEIGH